MIDSNTQKSYSLLVVEDEPELNALYKQILSDEGYHVDTAEDGQVALTKILQGGYDLVLLDIMLPHIDGLEILERLRTGPPSQQPNHAIVLLTNLAQDDAVKKGMGLGARGYMIKSNYTPGEFVMEIKNFLQNA